MMHESRQSHRESVSKRRLDFSQVSSPTYGKTFYIDVRKALLKEKVVKCIRHVGGRVEEFLSREVDILVTDRPMSVSGLREATLMDKNVGNPSSPNCVPLPSPDSPHLNSQTGSSSSIFASASSKKPLTRTQTLLMKAQQNYNRSQSSKVDQSSNSSLIQNAITLGIKVISVQEFLSTYQQQCKKLARDDTYQFRDDILLTGGPARSTRGSCKRSESVSEKENKPCLKVEDFSRKYRPLYKAFDTLPEISYDLGLNSRTSNSKKRQKIKTGNVSNFITPKEKMCGDRSTQRPSTVKGTGTKLVQRGGYCESCDHWYTSTTRTHINGSRHQQFAKNSEHYQTLDVVISKLPDLNAFLSSISDIKVPKKTSVTSDDDIEMTEDNVGDHDNDKTIIPIVTSADARLVSSLSQPEVPSIHRSPPPVLCIQQPIQYVPHPIQCMPQSIQCMPPPIQCIPQTILFAPQSIQYMLPSIQNIPPPSEKIPLTSSMNTSGCTHISDVTETDDTPQTVIGRPKVLRKLLEKCFIAENSDDNMVLDTPPVISKHRPSVADEVDGDIFNILNSVNQQITDFETDDDLDTKVPKPCEIAYIPCQPMSKIVFDSSVNNQKLPTLTVGDFNFGDTPNSIHNKGPLRKRLDFNSMPTLKKYSYDPSEKPANVDVIFGKLDEPSNTSDNLSSALPQEDRINSEASSPLTKLEYFEQNRKRSRVIEPSFKKSFYLAEKTSEMKLKIRKVKKDPLERKRDLKSYWKVRKAGDCKLVFSPKCSRQIGGATRASRRTNTSYVDDDDCDVTTDTGTETDDTEPIRKRQRVAPL